MAPRLYNKNAAPTPIRSPLKKVGAPEITPATKLVSVKQAAIEIANSKGWNISEKTIYRKCKSGEWQQGTHWVKPGKFYLINLDAVYWSLVQ